MESVAGPSRPRRVPAGPMDLGDRIIAIQRRNASAAAAASAAGLTVPAPQSSRTSARRPEGDEYSRGSGQPVHRALYDPSRPSSAAIARVTSPQPLVPSSLPPPSPNRTPREHRDALHRESSAHRRPESPSRTRGPAPARKLFDPTVHDPQKFARPPPPPPNLPSPGYPSHGSSGSHAVTEGSLRGLRDIVRPSDPALAVRRSQLPRTAEEEADKERERRRRKEGSERGSGSSGRKKDDGKSKTSRGSRSSEGSESFKDRERGKGKGDTGVKAILKDIHDRIRAIEMDLTEMHRKMTADPEGGIAVLLEPTREAYPRKLSAEEDSALWLDLIGKHKQLADLHHDFLARIFDPLVPPSLHQLTVRYNIPSRLWQNGFHLILERLRHSWMTGHPTALDLLTDFVYDAYKFYTDLLEDVALVGFRTAWIEALGDLARYRMAIASQLSLDTAASGAKGKNRDPVHDLLWENQLPSPEVPHDGASIGAEVADSWDVEDTDTWRQTARDWYSMGITEKPGEGRLHHHLALLARDVPDGEVRALHHFTRSLVVTHEFPTARESIQGLFDLASQRRQERARSGKSESVTDIFVRLHGMLFTRIELDRFDETLSTLIRALEERGAGQVDWMIMAAVNQAGMMQYGLSDGVLRKGLGQEAAERRRAQATSGELEDGEVEGGLEEVDLAGEGRPSGTGGEAGSSGVQGSDPETWPLPLTCAFRLAFTVFEYTLQHPTIPQGAHTVLNPYLSSFLTFLATLSRQSATAQIVLPWIPWSPLTAFLDSSSEIGELKPETKLVAGQPVPEDWLSRGAEWVGRRVYERGFWKIKPASGRGSGGIVQPSHRSGERFGSETDVLMAHFEGGVDVREGIVDTPGEVEEVDGPAEVGKRRWRRASWAVGVMLRYIEGLEVQDGRVVLVDPLKQLVEDAEKRAGEAEARPARTLLPNGRHEAEDEPTEEEWLDDNDPELAVLRDRFKHLQTLVSAPTTFDATSSRNTKGARAPTTKFVQGYTTLVFDTNVLLSSLSLFSRLVSSSKWTVVVPLPVVTELDGLSKEPPPLGIEAAQAISYLENNIRTRSMVLRIQTTKGSYLSDLRLRTELSTISDSDKRTMDDKILDVAKLQIDNFTDRSLMLGGPGPGAVGAGKEGAEASKAVLVTFDRNLRLRARAAGVDAVDEKEMARILGKAD